eukprot:TRINITY_DN6220_c0_g6_i2.p1 TRINITY_DN6220_c0_g6~~TRINITY_DN6220_c0_g6_i2.p1  ORF type:complete len:1170 (+),score=479.42 TRINITY_DN6220_c0_g6_i2:147-3656(+)
MAPKKDAKPADACLDPEVGADCLYYESEQHAWAPGQVTAWDGKTATVKGSENTNPLFTWETGAPKAGLKAHEVYMANKEVLAEDVSDLLNLTVLHDSTLLNVLRRRYFNDLIYTNIGAITVALNPFNFKIPWYTDDNMPKYLAEGDTIEKNIPHSWATAHNTYFEMRNAVCEPFNQCILVSGESGAGKTEASKIVMKYLAQVSTKAGTQDQKEAGLMVGSKINITSPPLETWGNAKTSRNDNSSRFGKFMKVKFSAEGLLEGAYVIKYLLEKSRIVTAGPGERVYHSFYLVTRGKDNAAFQLGKDSELKSLNAGKCLNNKEFDSAEEYDEVCHALQEIGQSPETVKAMWKVVAGILLLQNVDFDADGEGSKVSGAGMSWLEKAVALYECDKDTLVKELGTSTFVIGGSAVTKLLNPSSAADVRDSLCKHLYDNEFTDLIGTCNKLLDKGGGVGNWVGLLDIFGFEDFEVNSFEQICINLANESLQHHYNTYIFSRDMDECRAEGIDVTAVVFPDNTPCLQMVTAKGGIMALLDEECSLGSGTDEGFLAKVKENHGKNPFFAIKKLSRGSFVVKHYAKDVNYTVEGFLDKNRDTLKNSFKSMMRAVPDPYIKELLPEPVDDQKKMTVGGFYKMQLKDLMDLINSTNPHWIRCVKPHPAKKPLMYDGVSTLVQLSSSGVLGTVKIRKAGYPVRLLHEDFYMKYRVISPGGGGADACQKILDAAGITKERGQLGKTKVFMKAEAFIEVEKKKKEVLSLSAVVVQAWCRGYVAIDAVIAQVKERNSEAIERIRAEVKVEVKERWERDAEARKAEAERLKKEAEERAAKEEEERVAREKAEAEERVKNASKYLCEDEEKARKIIEDEESPPILEIFQAELEARQILMARLAIENLEKEESDARRRILEEEGEAVFEFESTGAELQQHQEMDNMRAEATGQLARNREARLKAEQDRKARVRGKERSLVERLAVPGASAVNAEARRELEERQESERLERSASQGSPYGSPYRSPASAGPGSVDLFPAGSPSHYLASPIPTAQTPLLVIPPGGQLVHGQPNPRPINIYPQQPDAVPPVGAAVYVHGRQQFATVTDLQPGFAGSQFRATFDDGSTEWCTLSDVYEHRDQASVQRGGYASPTRSSVSPVSPGPRASFPGSGSPARKSPTPGRPTKFGVS